MSHQIKTKWRRQGVPPPAAPHPGPRCPSPSTLLIACSDCAIDRRLAAHAAPGSMMIYGTPANRVTRRAPLANDQASRFERLLTAPTLTDLVVCGHSRCQTLKLSLESSSKLRGGAFASRSTRSGFAGGIMDRICDNIRQAALLLDRAKQETLIQLDHLRTYDPVADGERSATLTLHAWVYLDETGVLLRHRRSDSPFVPVDAPGWE